MASSDVAFGYVFENFGVQSPMSSSPVAAASVFENFGLRLPAMLNIFQPQLGWGLPVTAPITTVLITDDSSGVGYSYENLGVQSPGSSSPDADTSAYENFI